ncbi:MAG: hypothetical protein KatS3mg081_0327 [Gemmatimonadales bacterium]|nr:MAG: hypothetical protein KatS3mg081_0327 [Gemmatimonadales bacterium]
MCGHVCEVSCTWCAVEDIGDCWGGAEFAIDGTPVLRMGSAAVEEAILQSREPMGKKGTVARRPCDGAIVARFYSEAQVAHVRQASRAIGI